MNAFFEHHKSSIEFGYRCFDRLLLNGLIQPFQQPERVLGGLQCLPQWYPRHQILSHRHRRSISELDHKPVRKVGRSDSGGSRRQRRRCPAG